MDSFVEFDYNYQFNTYHSESVFNFHMKSSLDQKDITLNENGCYMYQYEEYGTLYGTSEYLAWIHKDEK